MSFLQRARDAATQAAEQARQAAERVSDPDHRDAVRTRARGAMGVARRGMKTVIERIDPGTLAEVVIRATSLQEMTNRALADKRSPYRIAGITISASVPPGVTFSIARLHDPDAESAATSTELAEAAADGSDAILSLDGTTIDAALVPMLEATDEEDAPGSSARPPA